MTFPIVFSAPPGTTAAARPRDDGGGAPPRKTMLREVRSTCELTSMSTKANLASGHGHLMPARMYSGTTLSVLTCLGYEVAQY